MKREKEISCLCAGAIAFLLGFGGTACMVTGLRLPADLFLLGCGCAMGAVIAAICLSFRRGGLILSGIAAAYSLLMVFSFRFWEQLRAMCYSTLAYYNRAYGMPIPDWLDGQVSDSQLLPLLFIAGLVMATAVRTVLRRKKSFPAISAAIVPLASCLVVTDTVPATEAVFLLLFGLILLIMTQAVRRREAAQGNRLTGVLLLPIAAALIGLFYLVPQGDYSAPSQAASFEDVLNWFVQKVPVVEQTSQGELVISMGGNAKDYVNLSQVGQRRERNTPVMEIATDYSGTLYLRGRDYDLYTGLGWEASEDRVEEGYNLPSIWCKDTQIVSIRVLGRRRQYYLPCYSTLDKTLTGGLLPNPDYKTSYSFSFSTLRSDWKMLYHAYESGLITNDPLDEPSPSRRYLALPDGTRQQAQEILNSLLYKKKEEPGFGDLPVYPTYSDAEKAEIIGQYVEASARYDTNTGRMPSSEKDFALWFLEDSDTGYCVHFASAATVLLRAAGIPARYVEGYTVEAKGGETTIVRERMSHAWVEYYLDHVGWVILDATPGGQTVPGETTEGTQATVPTETPTPTETITEPISPTADPSQPSQNSTSPAPIINLPGHGTGTGSATQWQVPQWFIDLLTAVLWMAVVVLIIVGQWFLRRRQKLKRLRRGRPNAQALSRYREAKRLARLCNMSLPEELVQLAEKAKFSQHALTGPELGQLDAFLQEAVQQLRKQAWYRRLISRFIFAAY